ncbi:HpcH/HpaI aldolase family protein [Szabonella alba]|uniref:Hydroxypyruvate/pyruvate aldolase n=1 Tax=Szabonella alba TaxID=2804194 RepID=A0A8K0VBS7_9RHOB|nr:aldolase/citrate lyase family protein [Szabonella alba]MBL4916270.1 4-hydroxy-2-oxo-heptane-1,7-dioate aldolase [Szabonella alba]
MDLPKNGFKTALREGRQQIGIWVSIPGSGSAEAIAGCGFDWLVIDSEHTALDLPTMLAMLQAVEPYPTHAVVRPGWNDATEIKRILDLGAQSIIVPYVQSPDEAAQAVAAVRYPPEGMRGVAGTTRASRYGRVKDYTARANAEICLLVQVETAQALDRIEEIAAVDGVDGIFIGPADLAASLGYPGQPSHPEVKARIFDAIRRVRAAGKPAGILMSDPAFAAEAVEAGTLFTAVDQDIALLTRSARALAAKWKGRDD